MGKSTGSVNKEPQSVKKLPYDMTDEEIRKKVDADVASHFKKKAAPERTKTDPAATSFFLEALKVKQTGGVSAPLPLDLTDYERISKKKLKHTATASEAEGSLTSSQWEAMAKKACEGFYLPPNPDAAKGDPQVQFAPVRWKFKVGEPLVDPVARQGLSTQLRRLHQWYLEHYKSTQNIAFPVRYGEKDFLNGDDFFYVEFSELYQMYHQDPLNVQILKLWCL